VGVFSGGVFEVAIYKNSLSLVGLPHHLLLLSPTPSPQGEGAGDEGLPAVGVITSPLPGFLLLSFISLVPFAPKIMTPILSDQCKVNVARRMNYNPAESME